MFKGKGKYWKWTFVSILFIAVYFFIGMASLRFIPYSLSFVVYILILLSCILVPQIVVARYIIKTRLSFDEIWMLNGRMGFLFAFGIKTISILKEIPIYPENIFGYIIETAFTIIIGGALIAVVLSIFYLITNTILKNKFKNINQLNTEVLDQLENEK